MREGWKIEKLGSLASYVNGYPFKPTDWAVEGLPIIRIQNLNSARDEYHYFKGSILPRYKVCKGDILISWSASLGVFTWNGPDALLNQHIFKVVFDKEEIIKEFFVYAVSYKLDEMKKLVHGATMQHITRGKFDGIDIPIPPLPEQQHIVDILDQEFAKIDALKANAEKSLQAAKDLFRHISNGYYNEPSPVSKLGDECIFVRGPFGGSLKKSCFVPSGYPVYEQQHAIYSTFTFRYFVNEEKYNEMKRFTTHPGDLIMSCSGTIGKVAIIPEDAPIGIINQALLKLTPKKRILPEYLKWYMQSISFEKDIQRHSKGAAIQNVASVAILKEIAIPVPTIEKQKQIVARLDDLNERCNALQENYQKALTLCDDLKQSLLRKAFNGEL